MSSLKLFSIDAAGDRHPYLQICDTVVLSLRTGELTPGQKLPTVRRLAEHLGVAVNTVASAYRELERRGIAEGRGRAGTFITLGSDPVLEEARSVALQASADLLNLGLTESEAKTLLLESLKTSAENR